MEFTVDEIKAVINNIGHSSTQPAVNNILTSHGITIQTLRTRMLAQVEADYAQRASYRAIAEELRLDMPTPGF